MSVTVTPPPSGDRGNGQDSRKAVEVETGGKLNLFFKSEDKKLRLEIKKDFIL